MTSSKPVTPAQAVAQDRGRPARKRHRESLAPDRDRLEGGLDQRGGLAFPAAQNSKGYRGERNHAGSGCLRDQASLGDQGGRRREITIPRGICGLSFQVDRQLIERAAATRSSARPNAPACKSGGGREGMRSGDASILK